MGYLTNKYVKDKNKKFWIQIGIDIFLIIMLMVVGMLARAEFDNGARFMLLNMPAFCTNFTLYQETLEHYGLSDGESVPSITPNNLSITGAVNSPNITKDAFKYKKYL